MNTDASLLTVDTLYNQLSSRQIVFEDGEFRDKKLYVAIINQLRDNHTFIDHHKTHHQSPYFYQV